MTATTCPGPFAPDSPARRLPWVLLIAMLLVLLALLGLGRILHPASARRQVAPRPLRARIYELPASRGAAAAKSAPGERHPLHTRMAHSRVAHSHRHARLAKPHVATPGSAVLAAPHHSHPSSATHTSPSPRHNKPSTLNLSTLQAQINAAVSQNDTSPPQIHDPHTLVARYYIASVMQKLQRIGDMNDPTELTGMPVLGLVIGQHGELQELKLLRSSGDARLDHDALQIARESAPFASFPDKLRHQAKHIQLVCYMEFEGYRQLYTGY
ncbi:MAG: hypothetical protein P8Z67_00050 [Gammaproteobacteria bacterium]